MITLCEEYLVLFNFQSLEKIIVEIFPVDLNQRNNHINQLNKLTVNSKIVKSIKTDIIIMCNETPTKTTMAINTYLLHYGY